MLDISFSVTPERLQRIAYILCERARLEVVGDHSKFTLDSVHVVGPKGETCEFIPPVGIEHRVGHAACRWSGTTLALLPPEMNPAHACIRGRRFSSQLPRIYAASALSLMRWPIAASITSRL